MVTVERVLPWRRKRQTIQSQVEPLGVRFTGPRRKEQLDMVTRAYEMAARAHSKQRRNSGEPYIVHPLAVAKIVAKLGLDEVTVAAALLHDAVEDTTLELDDIDRSFGTEVANIVDGVTKLDRLRFNSKEAQQAATFRKMLVAISKDVRVLLVKLIDRLHNMHTLASLPVWKQKLIARETLEVYAPMAHRLGMQEVKMQLEDLAFAALHPKRFAEIEHMVAERAPERQLYITQVLQDVRDRVAELGIDAQVVGREKHLYSIYDKMQLKGKAFDEINDLVGIRVIVDSVRDCYAALGGIHATWKPVQGRFKDYVAMPKFNLYQSLHTTVVGPQGKQIEVQIRTWEMHKRAETGIASHYSYKDEELDPPDLPWLARIIDWGKETSDPNEYMANLKLDLDNEDEVFVFTPQGALTTLPAKATPIDFAYAIHTDVGHRCVAAKVDGKLVPLSESLQSGQTVEIFTSKEIGAGPSSDWLSFVTSHRASSKIRQWFTRERREDAIVAGEADLKKALKLEGFSSNDFGSRSGKLITAVAKDLNCHDVDALYAAIGEGQLNVSTVVARLLKTGESDAQEQNKSLDEPWNRTDPVEGVGVRIEGLDDMHVRLSGCCAPVPGDEIIGFVTRGRGVSIHRGDCANAESLVGSQNDRLIEAEWDTGYEIDKLLVSLEIKAYDRNHLLADVSRVFSEQQLSIVRALSSTADDRIARLVFDFEIVDQSHLQSLIAALRGVDGVYQVERTMPYRPQDGAVPLAE